MPHKTILQIFSVSTFLAALLRFFQLFFTIDGETGFSVLGSYEKINIIIYVVICLLIFIPAFFSAVSSNRQPTRAPIPKSFPLLTVANFIIAICMLAKAGIKFISISAFTPTNLLEILFLLVSAVWFVIYASAGFTRIKLPAALSIAPVLVCLYNLISVFISHNGLANISENLISTLFLCAILLFFLLQSKIICKVAIRKSSRHIFTVAVVAFMLMVIGNLPPLIIMLMGKGDLLHTSSIFNLEYVVLGLYALMFTLQLYSKSKWPPSIHQHSTERMENADTSTSKTKFFIEHQDKQ